MTTAEVPSRTACDGVWIAIPAFNESGTIRALAERVLAICPRLIVVDDGSTDGTSACLEGLPVVVLRNEVNLGKADSLRTAFAYAAQHRAACVVTLDGDGQHDPADLPRLLEAWQERPGKMIIGARLHDRANIPRARYNANRFACFWISWASGYPIADSQSGFRIYPRAVIEIALGDGVRGSRFTFESEILIEAAAHGHRSVAVAIPAVYGAKSRASHFRPVLDIAKIVIMVAGRLLSQGMAPAGLLRSLRPPTFVGEPGGDAQGDGRSARRHAHKAPAP